MEWFVPARRRLHALYSCTLDRPRERDSPSQGAGALCSEAVGAPVNKFHSGGGPRGGWGRPQAVPLAVGDPTGTHSICYQSTDVGGESRSELT